MAVLVWGLLNAAHTGVLVTSDRTAALASAVNKRVELRMANGERIQGRLLESGLCFRGGLIRHCIAVKDVENPQAEVVKHVVFAWRLPEIVQQSD